MATNPGDIGRHAVVLGMNHTVSKTGLRDRLLFNGDKLEAALKALKADASFLETFILSTCNRVEIYAVVEEPTLARERLLAFLGSFHNIDVAEFRDHVYYYDHHKAVEHFYCVVASLDSVVIGEYQILGQVKDAYQLAHDRGNTGLILNKLFHFGVEAGKRVRTETKIGDGVLSISSAAVDLAKKVLGNLSNHAALVIGAGEMSELTAKNLAAAGVRKLFFANRTLENAVTMATRFGGRALLLDERASVMPECDIVISSTGAPDYIILQPEIRAIMAARKHKALFLIDIAAPRDIHPDVGTIPNVFLFGIDDLTQVVAENIQARHNEIDRARAIVTEDLEHYFEWYNAQKVVPTLVALRGEFESIRDRELDNYAGEIRALGGDAESLVRRVAASLTKKFLSTPSRVIKEIASDRESSSYVAAIARLFDLTVTRGEDNKKNTTDDGASQ